MLKDWGEMSAFLSPKTAINLELQGGEDAGLLKPRIILPLD